jgi:hypothetical protein
LHQQILARWWKRFGITGRSRTAGPIRMASGRLVSNVFEEFWPDINRKFLHER